MNKTEALQILAILKAAYPNSYRGLTQDDALSTAAVWSMQFADMPVDIVMLSVNKLIGSSPFPPAISEVKKKLSVIHWEAWEQLNTHPTCKTLSERARKQYERVYEITRAYKYPELGQSEPTLECMLPAASQMQLNGGDSS